MKYCSRAASVLVISLGADDPRIGWTLTKGEVHAREEDREEEDREEAWSERSVHETHAAFRHTLRSHRIEGDAEDRGDEEALGLHQEEQAPGQDQENDDQRGRQTARGLRREAPSEHVRDDEARLEASQVASKPPRSDSI